MGNINLLSQIKSENKLLQKCWSNNHMIVVDTLIATTINFISKTIYLKNQIFSKACNKSHLIKLKPYCVNIIYQPMEQLINLVQDRFRRVKQVQQKDYQSQQLRSLKDQQKQRCQKQSWLLAMVRLNKSVPLSFKNNYLTASYKIMKIIDPTFTHTAEQPNIEENFLNQFVYLYRHFFDRYEGRLNFKISVKNLLRPTNHNIINDMLKYLIDFSRDYYQQTFHWKMKGLKQKYEQKREKIEKLNQTTRDSQSNVFLKTNVSFDQRKRRTLNQFSKFSIFDIGNSYANGSRHLMTEQLCRKKCQAVKNYDILDINFPSFACMEKDRNNLQYITNKANQVFKQNKYRNGETRLSFNNYLSTHPKAKINQSFSGVIENLNDTISHPFKFSLVIQKNGYSNIEVTVQSYFRNNIARQSISRPHRYANFQVSSNFNKADYLINSMRVLRVSQNFQPNFMKENQIENIKSQNLPKISIINTERLARYGQNQNKQQNLIRKKPSINGIKVLGKTEQQKIMQQKQQKIIQARSEVIKQSKQKSNQYIPQKKFSAKVFSIRKHYPIQDKVRLRSNHKNTNQDFNEVPQQKVLKWLQKVKFAKDMERRKILGFH